MTSRCIKGKSCGATCIQRSKWCELELGPKVSKSLSHARERIGVLGLFAKVREHGVKGHKAKFDAIRKELKGQLGHQIRKTDDISELKKRLEKAGLLPKTKSENLGDIFAKQIKQGADTKEKAPRREFTPLPASIKAQLEALGGPRQLDRSPGDKTKTPPQALNKKNSMSLMLDDISRIMRGESPKDIQIASAPGFEGFKARFIPSSSGSKGSATGNTKWAREDAQDFDGALGKVRRDGSKSFNGWDGSYGSGARKIGEGAYGTVIRNPDGTFIKRGAVSDTEAALIKKLGEAGLGPKLIAADINGAHPYQKERFVDVRNGRIAMGEVPGKPIGYAEAYKKIGGKPVADIYWTAMAQLHRLGIAHNDAHIDNILVDKKGVGRWVDLGLAQASPKAALAEAMGIFNTLRGAPADRVMGAAGQGNWQTRRWNGTGVKAAETAREQGGLKQRMFERDLPVTARVFDNRGAAQFALLKMGLTRNDVSSIIDHGIRSPMDTYTKGVWSKITDKQAQEILNILYDGI